MVGLGPVVVVPVVVVVVVPVVVVDVVSVDVLVVPVPVAATTVADRPPGGEKSEREKDREGEAAHERSVASPDYGSVRLMTTIAQSSERSPLPKARQSARTARPALGRQVRARASTRPAVVSVELLPAPPLDQAVGVEDERVAGTEVDVHRVVGLRLLDAEREPARLQLDDLSPTSDQARRRMPGIRAGERVAPGSTRT